MRLLILLLFFYSAGFAQVRLISWNVQNLGSSKSDSIIAYMAQTVKDADIGHCRRLSEVLEERSRLPAWPSN